jgi:hypothetical protein
MSGGPAEIRLKVMNEMSSAPSAPPSEQAASPPIATTAPQRARWSAGRITAVAVGALLVLLSIALLGAGGTALWANWSQRDGGYVTSDLQHFSTAGSAVATEPIGLGSAGVGWLYAPALLGDVRIRVTPDAANAPLFVGIGRTVDVDRYLAGSSETLVSDFFSGKSEPIAGGRPASRPGVQRFWVASATGAGPQTVTWHPVNGSWTVVVMNADAHPGLGVSGDLGARMSALPWIALGVLVGGAIFLASGVLLIVGAIRRRPAQ